MFSFFLLSCLLSVLLLMLLLLLFFFNLRSFISVMQGGLLTLLSLWLSITCKVAAWTMLPPSHMTLVLKLWLPLRISYVHAGWMDNLLLEYLWQRSEVLITFICCQGSLVENENFRPLCPFLDRVCACLQMADAGWMVDRFNSISSYWTCFFGLGPVLGTEGSEDVLKV